MSVYVRKKKSTCQLNIVAHCELIFNMYTLILVESN